MRHRSTLATWFTFLCAFALTLLLAGCGPRWVIVRQANPNPLQGAAKFAIEPMHFESVSVGGKSEAEYMSGKDDKSVASWQEDKGGTTAAFTGRLQYKGGEAGLAFSGMPPADEQTFIIRPIVTFWEPGFYVGVSHRDSEMRLTVQVIGPQGVIDEITIYSRAGASLTSPSSGGRMRTCGEDLGNVVANYLKIRTGRG